MSRGTLDRLPSGRWRVRVPSPKGQITWGTFDTRELAERELANVITIADTDRRDYEGLTVRDLGERIVTRREVKREVRDHRSDRSRWDKHVKSDEIARVPVAKLQPKHVYAWIGRLKEKGLAAQTIRNCRNLLSVILTEACAQGTIKTNPCADVRVREAKVSSDAGWTYLVPEEQMRLLGAFEVETRCVIAFAMGTGLRAGELCALRRIDVDLEGRRIMVRFGGPPSEPTKTGRVRMVPLFGLALEATTAWLAVAEPAVDGALFPKTGRENSFGRFRDPNHVVPWKRWKAGLTRAGLGRRVRWHDLRHTCASSLVSGWWGRRWSLQEVKEMLGHTTIDITQRYAHLSPGALEEAGQGTSAGLSEPLVTNKSRGSFGPQNAISFDFLNRRSQVRLLSGVQEESSQKQAVPEQSGGSSLIHGVTSVTSGILEPLGGPSRPRPGWLAEATANLAMLLAGVAP